MADRIDIQPKRTLPADDQQESANVVELLGQLTSQASHLAQAELREGIDDLKIAIGSLVGAAVVGISSLGVVAMGPWRMARRRAR
ncbi:MAG: hypothetical protein WA948_10455 [Pontixanthobacter sp.]